MNENQYCICNCSTSYTKRIDGVIIFKYMHISNKWFVVYNSYLCINRLRDAINSESLGSDIACYNNPKPTGTKYFTREFKTQDEFMQLLFSELLERNQGDQIRWLH